MRSFARITALALLFLPLGSAFAEECPVGDPQAFEAMMEKTIVGTYEASKQDEAKQQQDIHAETDALIASGRMTSQQVSDFYLAILQDPAFTETERRKREVLLPRYLGALRKIAMDGSADDCGHAREMASTLEEMIALNKQEYALMRERLRARSAATAP